MTSRFYLYKHMLSLFFGNESNKYNVQYVFQQDNGHILEYFTYITILILSILKATLVRTYYDIVNWRENINNFNQASFAYSRDSVCACSPGRITRWGWILWCAATSPLAAPPLLPRLHLYHIFLLRSHNDKVTIN